MSERATSLDLRSLLPGKADRVAVLALDRPTAANAFNDAVMRECIEHLETIAKTADVRALILRGKGKHFSAGADLGWMKASAKLSYAANVKDAGALTALFEALVNMEIPTIAVVSGSAFGGAVGLTACCDYAIGTESAKFSLSEVKLGLAPAVIMPYLARKMRQGSLRRLALTGKLFDAREALSAGLLERVVADAELTATVREEIGLLLAGSPAAQSETKSLLNRVMQDGCKQGSHTAEAIAKLRTSPAGQAGLTAFFDKQPAPWASTLAPDWRFAEDVP